MKKLKYAKKITTEMNAFGKIIETYCDKLNKEYAKKMNELIENIALGEGLDIEILKKKYLTSRENEEDTDEVLDKITINNIPYYYENKEGGKLYDAKSNIVGKHVNNVIEFNT